MRSESRHECVLLVDDDPDIRDFVEHAVFRANGFDNIATAGDGSEGLALASALMPDLIVTNVMMSGLDGFEMVRRIRTDKSLTEPCIFFLTAKALSTDKVLGMEAGADEYVTKPFDPAELWRKVDDALAQTAERRRGLAARRLASGEPC